MKDPGNNDVPLSELEDSIPTAKVESKSGESTGFNHTSDDIMHANLRRIPINKGEGNWIQSLSVADHDMIELKNNDGWLMLLSIAGVLAMVGAIVLAVIFVPGMIEGKVRKPIQAGTGIVTLFVFGMIGAGCMFNLGRKWVFSQADRSLTNYHWQTAKTELKITPGYHLVLKMAPTDKDGDQICSLEMHNDDCTEINTVTAALSMQPSAGFIARLAGRAAVMLNVPLRLHGEVEKGHSDLKLWWGLYQRLEETGQLELPEDFDQEGIEDYAKTVGLPNWTKAMIAVVIVTMLSSFLIVSWMKALMWIGAQGIGLLIFFIGFNAVRTGEAEGKHGERYSGGKGKLVGICQMLAGGIFLIAMPIALLFSPEPKWGYCPVNDSVPLCSRFHDPVTLLSPGTSY
ncbi:MAG TPA: hypothetical protein PLN21_12285 [Gemmatales bacterium]|nr:hypothetical protein [Gemmatales bacterium]